MITRIQHFLLALKLLPLVIVNPQARYLLAEMRGQVRRLPTLLKRPLLEAMARLKPTDDSLVTKTGLTTTQIRELADLAALLGWRSPLGICLRRSLLRYHYLGRAGIPLQVMFGARFDQQKTQPKRNIAGHAWVEHNGRPYFEASENWRNFVVMVKWPVEQETTIAEVSA